jgi:hypothetical protein
MEERRSGTERTAPSGILRNAEMSKDEERARESVAIAMRIVGPPDAASVRNLE